MTREQKIIQKQKELIEHLMAGSEPANNDAQVSLWKSKYNTIKADISALESEPDIDDAEMSFNEHFEDWYKKDQPTGVIEKLRAVSFRFEDSDGITHSPWVTLDDAIKIFTKKEAEERKTAEEREKIFAKMQQDFQPTLETPFKQGMYSGYAFGLQDGYKFASQRLPEITEEEIGKEAFDLARKHSQQSVGDFAVGFNWCAKWYRDELKRRLK